MHAGGSAPWLLLVVTAAPGLLITLLLLVCAAAASTVTVRGGCCREWLLLLPVSHQCTRVVQNISKAPSKLVSNINTDRELAVKHAPGPEPGQYVLVLDTACPPAAVWTLQT